MKGNSHVWFQEGKGLVTAPTYSTRYFLSKKKGKLKIFADGRKKREIPHQTDVNTFLRLIGPKKARNLLRKCLDYQLKEALYLELISKKVNVLIDFTEHSYYGKRDDKMIKGTNGVKEQKKCAIT